MGAACCYTQEYMSGESHAVMHVLGSVCCYAGTERFCFWCCRALVDSGVHKDEVNYVNAHGTSTPVGKPFARQSCLCMLCHMMSTLQKALCACGLGKQKHHTSQDMNTKP